MYLNTTTVFFSFFLFHSVNFPKEKTKEETREETEWKFRCNDNVCTCVVTGDKDRTLPGERA